MAEPLVVEVLRTLDLLVLRFELRNLVLVTEGGGGPRLLRDDAEEDSFVVVHLPPQHVAEQPFAGPVDASQLPVLAGVSRPTRLAFKLPANVTQLPFTLAALLDWSKWTPSLVPAALPPEPEPFETDPPPPLRPPGTGDSNDVPETAIELPYRVVLSPHRRGGWAHATAPVTHAGRTELWHTRLGRRGLPTPDGNVEIDEAASPDRTARAVWSPDLTPPGDPPPGENFPNPLEPGDRSQLVHLSANFGLLRRGERYLPLPMQVDSLALSALGGWLRIRGEWDPPDKVDLEQWQHVVSQGRDNLVRKVHAGFLYPFGHRAAKITIFERKILPVSDGSRTAAVSGTEFVVVRETRKRYDRPDLAYPHQGREMPLAQVRLTTLATPLDPEAEPVGGRGSFWVIRDGLPVRFSAVGTDTTGADVPFQAALIFVPKSVVESHDGAELDAISRAYVEATDRPPGSTGPVPRRRIPVPGPPMAFAPPLMPGDTTLVTHELIFGTHLDAGQPGAGDRLPFLPQLETASVRLPAVEQLLGSSEPAAIVLADPYKRVGMASQGNAAQLFVTLSSQGLNARPTPERGGALANPDFEIKGVSRHLGPVGGNLEELAMGTFDPGTFFGKEAKLLGVVPLSKLVANVFEPAQFPKMLRRVEPTAALTVLDWAPTLATGDIAPLVAGPNMSLAARTEITQPLDGSPGTAKSTAVLRDFSFDFANVLSVRFKSLTFTSVTGQKADVSAELSPDGIEFRRALRFLNTLRRFIPVDGFRDPPAVEVTSSGVAVGYTLPLPAIAVGVFALQNVRLAAGLALPFTDGKPRLRFAFSERHEPFLLTVSGLGGGGFFGLALGLDGIELIEASLEFGAATSIDIGVASGGVMAMAGIYFRYDVTVSDTELTGFFECGGALQVLGIICISVHFYLGLSYHFETGRVEGEAVLTVKVRVLFFSKKVSLRVQRTFAGGEADPPFGEIMSADDWAAYAAAFA